MATVSLIRTGIDDVLTQRNGLTTTLREHIVNHDVVKDRELERLLRDINKELVDLDEDRRAPAPSSPPNSCRAPSTSSTCARSSTTRRPTCRRRRSTTSPTMRPSR